MRKRKMTAKQLKYFGKRKKVGTIAKRRTRYVNVARRGYRRARGLGGSKFGGIIPPLLGGIVDEYVGNFNILGFKLPQGAGATVIGWFMHDPITRNIGLYQVGRSIPSLMQGGGGLTGGSVISQV